ncbi:MAG TPA: family 10 glycosylhydrolase [Vicinamibacterales bacterium]|nr:family 10 glycosylhydrolase [Vicinamibacterales bacterium]
MRSRSTRLAFVVVFAAVLSIAPSARGLQTSIPTAPAPREVRGLWVLRTSLTSAAAIERMVTTAAEAGYNTLLVQVRGRGDAYYLSDIEPRAADLGSQRGDFDPLAATIAFAHRAGLQVHAWVNVNLVSSAVTLPRAANHVVRRHPEWLMVPAPLAGRLRTMAPKSPGYVNAIAKWTRESSPRGEGIFLSPITDGSQDYTVRVVNEIVERYDIDGLHLDYIRYPSNDFDYSRPALDAFRAARHAATQADRRSALDRSTDPLAWTRAFPEAWDAFRRERLTTLVHRIVTSARTLRPGITISAAVVPDHAEARTHRYQDWAGWASAGYLDVVCPMIYTQDAQTFASQVNATRKLLGETPMWAGIGAYRLPVAQTGANLRAARRAGAAGILLFSYDSLTGAEAPSRGYLTALKPILLEPHGDAR